jgi:tRNA threonylcarbamoyladenosine biosynthesis protein TsaB
LIILALDTSTEACSVALWADGAVTERFELGSQHSERILPMTQEALAEAGVALTQIDAVAFGRGPGSFTGLRICAGVAQGLAFGADVPVLPVSSLAALAQGIEAPGVLAAFDARMDQLYWGAYVRNARGLVELSGAEKVLAPRDIPANGARNVFRTRVSWRNWAPMNTPGATRSRPSRRCRSTCAMRWP